jgi:hypothetical protein
VTTDLGIVVPFDDLSPYIVNVWYVDLTTIEKHILIFYPFAGMS